MRWAIIFGIGLLLMPATRAQTKPDLTAVLKKVSEIYKAATQYEFIEEVDCHTGSASHLLFAFRAPNKYRVQSGSPCLKPGEPDTGGTLRVNDGSTLWAYDKRTNQYVAIPANMFGDTQTGSIGQAAMSRYRGLADVADQVKFVREETLTLGASKANCYVVLVPQQGDMAAETWWIDKVSYHVVRIDNDQFSVTYTTIKLNEPLPDELFKFVPPPGAKKLDPAQ